MIISSYQERGEQFYRVSLYHRDILKRVVSGKLEVYLANYAFYELQGQYPELNKEDWIPFVLWTATGVDVIFG